ncbi:MAG TPA: bifunctional UDP-3-O-[3-hydroxymyristoyl] N-acetylglucosamine deacetylase/3-hydroxyacyl-ACP dehydratase [Longimicrobiales bacterium]|nr:bifunctional UDP-3-O-[3-hydroxymyristoyl] N-acetylglucosamine deacetylase/3-hydroxyacyl-ACP dehydratase [Longimicrobiales bacterium]
MESIPQRSVAREATLQGVGVHSGEAATLTVRPAEPGSGLRFRRTDLPEAPEIRADLDHVVATELGTTLGAGETRVLTVEHLLAALAAHGIDNALLDLSGPEPPIRDGSFNDYLQALEEAGAVDQDLPARVVHVHEPVVVREGGGESYVATPCDGYRIAATIDFEHPAIRRQFGSFDLSTASFAQEIAPARTFGFMADAEALRARGMARGASLENTVVLDEDRVLNDGLRFPDEFLRHKVGDMVGDLKLLGARIRGHIVAERPSHRGNVALARALAEADRKREGRPILDAGKIMQYLPHRFPMLLVDRIVDFESGKRIVGIKNVTINEPFFQGHYPGHPIMPGVLVIEAMAQVGGLLLMDAVEGPENYVVYFMSLDNVKWRRPVTPGDQIVFELEMLQFRRHVCKMRGVGKVEGRVVAEADLMARIVERGTDDE